MRQHTASCLEGPRSPELRQRRRGRLERQQDDEGLLRTNLVQRIRAELAAGTYLTLEKWEIALDRLAERLI